MEKKMSFFKKKEVTASFSIFALASGFIFLTFNSVFTGNFVSTQTNSFNPISLIGALLVFCSVILAFYTVKRN